MEERASCGTDERQNMKVRTQVLLVLAMIAALLATTPGGVSAQTVNEQPPEEAAAPLPLTDADIAAEIGYWQITRESMGFKSDERRITRIAKTEVGEQSVAQYSFPMTQNEVRRFEEHQSLASDATAIMEAFSGHDNYGGVYIAAHVGDGLVVNTVGVDPALRKAVRDLVSQPQQLRFETVEFSYMELRQASQELYDDIRKDETFVERSVDVTSNSVVIGLSSKKKVDEHRNQRSQMQEALRNNPQAERAPGLKNKVTVKFEESAPETDEACTSRSQCGGGGTDFRGGILIEDANGRCTSGFVVDYNFNSNVYMLTAGHCDNTVNKDVEIGGEPHTNGIHEYQPWSNLRADGSNADAVLVGLAPAETSSWIYRRDNNVAYNMTSVKQNTTYPTGLYVCIAARVRFFRCGSVIDGSYDFTSGGIDYVDHVRWKYTVNGSPQSGLGSSGGPFFRGREALGIHRGGVAQYLRGSDRTVYRLTASKIAHIEDRLNVTVRTG